MKFLCVSQQSTVSVFASNHISAIRRWGALFCGCLVLPAWPRPWHGARKCHLCPCLSSWHSLLCHGIVCPCHSHLMPFYGVSHHLYILPYLLFLNLIVLVITSIVIIVYFLRMRPIMFSSDRIHVSYWIIHSSF